jgi:hypothetical protein
MSTNVQAMHEVARQVALSRWRGSGADSHRRPESAHAGVARATPDSAPRGRKDRHSKEND